MTRSRYPIRRVPDGRALLNLGSNTRVAPGWNNVDFSWIIRLGRHRNVCKVLHRLGLLSQARYERIQQFDPQTVVWDLRRGIPFPEQTFDAVYHSHVLEHIDREGASGFLRECWRVLKSGGIVRIVVPDLEALARRYIAIVDGLPSHGTMEAHTSAVEAMIDQMIVRTPRVRAQQKRLVQWAEHVLIGDTARAGVLHRWMYDRFSLGELLRVSGFERVRDLTPTTSQIVDWKTFNLDTEPDGTIYKPDSLYVEGSRS